MRGILGIIVAAAVGVVGFEITGQLASMCSHRTPSDAGVVEYFV